MAENELDDLEAELSAMKVIGTALKALNEPVRARVLRWIDDHFERTGGDYVRGGIKVGRAAVPDGATGDESEIPGIARMVEGRLEITARDLKAKSTNDAAIRLVHIALLANEKFTGQRKLSSRRVLVPLLKEWRAYDGNVRGVLAQHKGIRRSGDELELDMPARQEAENYMQQILDESVSGTWTPRARSIRKKKSIEGGDSSDGEL